MKKINTIITAFAVSLVSMYSHALTVDNNGNISPAGASFTANGTIIVQTPALSGNVSCNVSFTGKVSADGKSANINTVTTSGGFLLCSQPSFTGLPWILNPSSGTSAVITNVGFTIPKVIFVSKGATCGASTVTVSATQEGNAIRLKANNSNLAGNCKIVSLDVVAQ